MSNTGWQPMITAPRDRYVEVQEFQNSKTQECCWSHRGKCWRDKDGNDFLGVWRWRDVGITKRNHT